MIPLVDVKAQYAPLIPELKARFAEVLESGRFIFGPEVEAFERESAAYLGVPHAIGVANGTDALVLSLEAMGIGAGDEVICPSFTFYATAEAIARAGATPVFADIDPITLNLDPEDVAARITPKTKAIMPVHLFGRPAPLAELAALGLPLIEDSAQAFGAAGVASEGVCSTFSFFPTKNLFSLGDGGLIACRDDAVAERVKMLRFHGSRDKQTFELIGTNSRLDAIQAAALRVFLPHLAGLERGAPGWSGALCRSRSRQRRRPAAGRTGPRVPHVRRAHARACPDQRGAEGGGYRVGVLLRDAPAPAARDAVPRLRARLSSRDGACGRRQSRASAVGLHRCRCAGAGRLDRARCDARYGCVNGRLVQARGVAPRTDLT